MISKTRMMAAILLLSITALVNDGCQKKGDSGDFSAADLDGKWKCYKISTLWKSLPDSVTNSPVGLQSIYYRITADSISDYVKTDSARCYTKGSMAVVYSTNPPDTAPHDSTLIIMAQQSTEGIVLQYNYVKTDSIREYYLQKIDTPLTINVCDQGAMAFKTRMSLERIKQTVPVRVQCTDRKDVFRNFIGWF